MAYTKHDIVIPLTVPAAQHARYVEHYLRATRSTGKFFLFAADHKIEHLHDDFYGQGIPEECANPEHLFSIASQAPIGAFATQLGLVARYGRPHGTLIPYIIKLNSKTNIIPLSQADPVSRALHTVKDVVNFADQSGLLVIGVGYTVYLGGEHEAEQLREAAQIIMQAHQHGLLVVLWMYPRGSAVGNERDIRMVAGAAGVGNALGADFVKINPPVASTSDHGLVSSDLLKIAVQAAGNSGLLCSGGSRENTADFLLKLHEQLHQGGVNGYAVGRNIHQRNVTEALALCNSIAAILFENATVVQASKYLV